LTERRRNIRRQPALGRHPERVVTILDRSQERAFVGLTGDDRRTAIATAHERFARINLEAVLGFLAAVTRQAFGHQDWPNPSLEKLVRGLASGCESPREKSRRGK
jgi:hypothetical protein